MWSVEAFWALVVPSDGCWEWRGFRNRNTGGYGRVNWMGRKQRAHRVAYALSRGIRVEDIPVGLHVLHACDTPSCVRPDHLSLGTHAENLRQAVVRGRIASGARNGAARLTEEQARDIRVRLLLGESRVALAREHGVSDSAINRLARGEAWVSRRTT